MKEKRLGLLPEILSELLTERKRVKKLMKQQIPHSTMYNVHDGTQLALKVCCNSIYGFCAGYMLPCREIASSVTKYGRGLILKTKSLIENHKDWGNTGHGCKCVYGDSVSGNTPLLIRVGHHVEIVMIKDLKLNEPTYTWTEKGWTLIQNIVKHKLGTHKKMLQICTHTGIVHCTNDHSLVTHHGEPISPDDVQIGTRLIILFGYFPTMICKVGTQFTRFLYKGKTYESGKDAWKRIILKISQELGNG